MRGLLTICLLILSFSATARKEGQARIDSLLAELPTATSDTIRVKFLNNISSEYSIVDPEAGLKYAEQALSEACKQGFKPGIAMAHYNYALNYHERGNLSEAITHYTAALKSFEEQNKPEKAAVIYTTIAGLYNAQGETKKAKEMLLSSLALKTKLGDTDETAFDLSTLGEIYGREKDSATALGYLRRAESIFLKKGLHYELGSVYTNFANTYSHSYDFSHALEYHVRATQEFRMADNVQGQVISMGNVGGVYLGMAQLEAAADGTGSMGNETQRGLVPGGKIANARKAIEYFENAVQLASKVGLLDEVVGFAEGLAEAYSLVGDNARALEAYKQFSKAKDSLNARANNERLLMLETRFETREKDKQIAYQKHQLEYNRNLNLLLGVSILLAVTIAILIYASQRKTSRLNREISARKAELEQLNEVKNKLFGVISHDLRTPVNSLITFTQLLEHGNLPQEKLIAYTSTLKGTLTQTAGLMENLLNWARTQMQGYKPVLERFDLADVAQKVMELQQGDAMKKELNLNNFVPTGSLVIGDINMTELLLRNLVSNAIKYTATGGNIEMEATHQGAYYYLTMRDTGKGMTPEVVSQFNNGGEPKAFQSTPGTNKEHGTGLGLMLCKTFATLMNGKITATSEMGKGSTFILQIPASE
ncbi:MAG: tetratricopeptide repeat-containing sensor histidine kinase [Taibaiella sp.]|nr:tetratricopeptide repeat-containing sensor histidine kinase [Taibaiella sp.]